MKHSGATYGLFKIVNKLFMLFIGMITVYPYLNVAARAVNDGADTFRGGLTIFPRVPTLDNFSIILNDASTGKAALVSVMRVVLGTIFALIVQFAAAYAFTKKGLFGRKVLLIYLTIPMFFSGGLIPQYLLYSKIGLLNNVLVYIIPAAFSFYNMIIIRTYMNTIPQSLEESAKLDGANEIVILARIIIPLSLPILATVCLWIAVGHWNDWVTTLYFITNSRYHTLQFILVQMIQESDRIAKLLQEKLKDGVGVKAANSAATPDAIRSAQVIITTLPIILVYPFLQKYFIKGVMIGGIKE